MDGKYAVDLRELSLPFSPREAKGDPFVRLIRLPGVMKGVLSLQTGTWYVTERTERTERTEEVKEKK